MNWTATGIRLFIGIAIIVGVFIYAHWLVGLAISLLTIVTETQNIINQRLLNQQRENNQEIALIKKQLYRGL